MPDLAMPYPTPASLQCFGWQAVSIARNPDLIARSTRSAVLSFFQAVPQKMGGKAFILLRLQQIVMSSIEEQLILSQLPYPKYYDGRNWNTVINKSRRNIPEYLREDLPKLKFQPIREEFKKLNQIECPRLAYFNEKMLKEKLKSHCHSKNTLHDEKPHRKSLQSDMERESAKLQSIRIELQYALLTSNHKSNVIRNLISKATEIEEESKSKKRTKRSKSQFVIPDRQQCFENTLNIVINARKSMLKLDEKQQSHYEEIEKKVEAIAMLPYLQ